MSKLVGFSIRLAYGVHQHWVIGRPRALLSSKLYDSHEVISSTRLYGQSFLASSSTTDRYASMLYRAVQVYAMSYLQCLDCLIQYRVVAEKEMS